MRPWTSTFRAAIEQLSAEQIALAIVVGLILGVFPIMGFPTILCLGAAFAFRLNAAVLQLVNNITSPLQFALLLPLERAGAHLCGGWDAGGTSNVGKIGVAALHAVAGWSFICVPVGVLGYAALVVAMRTRRGSWCNTTESPAR